MYHVQHRPALALGLRTLAALAIATMFMMGKVASERGINLQEVMFWRQVATLPILFGWLTMTGGIGRLRTTRFRSHMFRGALGMLGMSCNFGAAMMLPLAEATTLGFTGPLFAVLVAAFVLREKIGRWRWSAVALGFAGVLLIARPGAVAIPLDGAALGLGAGLLNALISFQIRDLSRSEEPIAIVFYFALYGTAVMSVSMLFYAQPHPPADYVLLIGIGVIGTIGQMLLTGALRFGAVSTVMIMDYTQLIWATLFGGFLWGALPSTTTWLGAPLVVAAGLVIAWRETRHKRPVTPVAMLEEA